MKKTPFYIFLLLSAWSWSQTTYLHCGQVFDSEKAKMLGPHTLVIEGEKIKEVKIIEKKSFCFPNLLPC